MIYNYFPVKVREVIKKGLETYNHIEEIRVRCGQNIVFCNQSNKLFLDESGNLTEYFERGIKLYKDDMKEMLKYFTQNSVYAMQQDIKNGFVTLADGTRIGLCGRCVVKNGEIENINNISSFNIRLSRQVAEWGYEIFDEIRVTDKNILIIAPPGLGKTTLLRSLIKYVSDCGMNVSVVDEKCEISPVSEGNMIYDLGINTDVLSDAPKNSGINAVLRTMNPQIIATDELLTKEDFELIKNISLSGVKILSTFHGKSLNDYETKMKSFGLSGSVFDCYIAISLNENYERVIKYELRRKI